MPPVLPASEERPLAADRLPTLTEVVELGHEPIIGPSSPHAPEAAARREPQPEADVPAVAASESKLQPAAANESSPGVARVDEAARVAPIDEAARVAPIDEAALVAQVLDELTPRIDALFETRLSDALEPALARAAEGLLRDTRAELGSLLNRLVRDAVAQALAGLRRD